MGKAVNFTFSVPSQRLKDDFQTACRKRQMKFSTVLSSAMRYFIAHPKANGWVGKGVSIEPKKKV